MNADATDSEKQSGSFDEPRGVVAVLGAGVIGSGVAQVFAQCGYRVVVIDLQEEILEHCRKDLTKNLRFQGFFRKSGAEQPGKTLDRISFLTDYKALGAASVVIENITEKWEAKRDLYNQIRDLYSQDALIGINTSAISITRIAALTRNPSRAIGMHFMNPVPLTAAVELIRGFHTSSETVEEATRLMHVIGKQSVVVNDLPGFVSNRILMLTINEAIWVVHDQVAPAADVDLIFKLCFGHKMGPLETADLIGLDTILLSLDALYESYLDTKFRACPLLRIMVDAGLRGRKSGEGFYKYRAE